MFSLTSRSLPFDKQTAPAELHPVWISFANKTMRYRLKPYAGKLHLILSESNARGNLSAARGGMAGGGIAVTVVPGDHEAYIRAHIDTAGEAFSLAMKEDE
jgi:hypothetical protein